jgi:hypothetical protein
MVGILDKLDDAQCSEQWLHVYITQKFGFIDNFAFRMAFHG